jgi:enoyl-CoA hydratase
MDHILESSDDGVLELTLVRPDKLNAVSPEMLAGIKDAVARFGDDRALRVMLISARGPYFTSGIEVTADISPAAGVSALEGRAWYRDTYHRLFDEIEAIEKPFVVAHQGHCWGFGLEMSLSCDFRFAAREATYRLPEIEFGALPGSGGVSRLVRIAGPHWARWLVMAGESMSAEQALQSGLVHALIEQRQLIEYARDFCRQLARRPYEYLGLAKLSIELATDLDRAQGRNVERIANSMLFGGAEHKALVEAFIERQAHKRAAKQATTE